MQSFEAGPFLGSRLLVGHQLGRIDLVLMPDQTSKSEGLPVRHLGDFGPAMDKALPAARKMFRPDMIMQRLAIGAVLRHPVQSAIDAYKVLRSILPVARDVPETTSDFFLQLNVPVTLSLTGNSDILVNRLLKWNAVRLQSVNIVDALGAPALIADGVAAHFVRMEMDINTPVDLAVPLSHKTILDVIDHLAAQARAIVANSGWFPE
jgi:hypothetical protein